MRWFIYGEVQFTRTQDRDRITRRLNDRAAAGGFTPDPLPLDVSGGEVWPSGWVLVAGQPLRVRFSYSTRSQAVADEVYNDVASWAVRNDVDSSWGYHAVPD